MKLIVGLGNPGKEFNNTRHNIGFEALDFIRENLDLPKFKIDKKLKAAISKDKDLILAQPQTFMNESGQAVAAIKKYYKIKLADIIVLRDDVDIEIGKIKSKKGSAGAGHKGIQSIIQHLKSKNFWQIKIGVANEMIRTKIPTEKFVLQKFTKEDEKKAKEIPDKTITELNTIIKDRP
ncbi:aminoacyl-tRNA hydrolase [Patescibacteria group bacterium]